MLSLFEVLLNLNSLFCLTNPYFDPIWHDDLFLKGKERKGGEQERMKERTSSKEQKERGRNKRNRRKKKQDYKAKQKPDTCPILNPIQMPFLTPQKKKVSMVWNKKKVELTVYIKHPEIRLREMQCINTWRISKSVYTLVSSAPVIVASDQCDLGPIQMTFWTPRE